MEGIVPRYYTTNLNSFASTETDEPDFISVGGGIAGLTLAAALDPPQYKGTHYCH